MWGGIFVILPVCVVFGLGAGFILGKAAIAVWRSF
jgi:hypothetical protein